MASSYKRNICWYFFNLIIIIGDFDKADIMKKQIEDEQRKIRKEKEHKNEKHKPFYFEVDKEVGWKLKKEFLENFIKK
jgi:hypothetical protein